jgi:hypothetical protein
MRCFKTMTSIPVLLSSNKASASAIRAMKAFSRQRTFRVGNDVVSTPKTVITLPIFVGKQFGDMLTYIVPGGVPILIARPIMDNMGMIMDFGRQRARWGNANWVSL